MFINCKVNKWHNGQTLPPASSFARIPLGMALCTVAMHAGVNYQHTEVVE